MPTCSLLKTQQCTTQHAHIKAGRWLIYLMDLYTNFDQHRIFSLFIVHKSKDFPVVIPKLRPEYSQSFTFTTKSTNKTSTNSNGSLYTFFTKSSMSDTFFSTFGLLMRLQAEIEWCELQERLRVMFEWTLRM